MQGLTNVPLTSQTWGTKQHLNPKYKIPNHQPVTKRDSDSCSHWTTYCSWTQQIHDCLHVNPRWGVFRSPRNSQGQFKREKIKNKTRCDLNRRSVLGSVDKKESRRPKEQYFKMLNWVRKALITIHYLGTNPIICHMSRSCLHYRDFCILKIFINLFFL